MSYQIRIEHNPFTIETVFKIRHSDEAEWQQPAINSSLANYANKRLQLWVENFFEEVDKNEFNEYGQFDVIFQGVEADYLDIQASAEKAKEKGIHINLSWEQAEEPSARLENIKELMQEAKNNPIFAENINNSQEIQSNFEAALNRDFDVYVAATMSAGKSTFINAMLGCELLPNANEATTATIAQIVDNDTMPQGEFVGERYNKDGELVHEKQTVTLDTLKEWNALADTKLIKLEGNIIGVKEREDVRLVISDTPGPNNSQDRSHWETTQKYIQDSQRNPLILYILNGTQLGTNDDKNVLSMIGEIMQKGGKQSKDRFIFVVNKMDGFDFEKETTPEKVLENVRAYLRSNGIEEPQVYPVSALNAGLLRQRQDGKALTRTEQQSLSAWEYLCLPDGDYQGIDFVEYMPLTSSSKTHLATRKLMPAEHRTGIPAIEVMIDEYINKYNLPNRVNRAYIALKTAIEISSNEQALIASLNLNRDELDKVAEILSNLKNSESIKNNAKGKIDSLLNDDKLLYSSDIIQQIDEQEASIRTMLREFSNQFYGKQSKSVGQGKLDTLERDIHFKYDSLTNIFDNLVKETQKYAKIKLKEIFEEFNNELFAGQEFSGLPLPVLDGLKHRMASFEISLSGSEIKTKTETKEEWVGTKTVSDSTWYKPWTWGNKRTVDVYETRTITEEYVILEELFSAREPEIRQQFDGLIRSAKEKIQADTEKYLAQFKDFLTEEFDKAMKEILTDLTQKTQDKSALEAEIEVANQKLEKIQQFKQKLDEIIELKV